MLLLVGLGNPGQEYAGNRHNIGAMVVDEIVRRHGFSSPRTRSRPQGIFSEGLVEATKIVTLKPLTYMNDSGQAVGDAMRYWRLEPNEIFVLHDELDLAPGKVRAKRGGGHAGHNGLRSIDSHIGQDYWRVRIGVGHPGDKDRVTGHVLRDFSKADKDWVTNTLDAIADAIPLLFDGDAAAFTTRVALLTQPLKSKKEAGDAAPSTENTKEK
ncbi:MAG: aminoacyl-tRNA hydrolase [Rhodospirillaceae bacterium]|nr:aminoacyl-tRNA hydrolase [Rhodospirillaceae bacterium]|tara:strand:+ start:295 stop:930 length:636 start_codon:yes stop_codon:yes gene_type:complete